MPRRNLVRSDIHFYHVTTRSNHKHWFKLRLEDVWGISKIAMKKAMDKNPVVVAQYILMGNHYHLLIKTPNRDLDRFMYFFNKTFSEQLRLRTGEINRMFGSRYKACLIKSDQYFKTVYRYIYQNPVRAGLIKKCQDYPFSTLYYQIQNKEWVTSVENVFDLDCNFLNYLNQNIDENLDCEVRNGLKKVEFKRVCEKKW